MSTSPVPHSEAGSGSQPGLSPNHSQSQLQEDVPIETLVSHLLASKRSLSSISSVLRANELVTSARVALEESVVLGARTGFIRKGIEEQVIVLKRFRRGIDVVGAEGKEDFKDVLKGLDAANAQLEDTMEALRSTIVEAAFRPEGEEPRNLLDFVDEESVKKMHDSCKEAITEAQEAQLDLDHTLFSFDTDLRTLTALLSPSSTHSHPTSSSKSSLLPPKSLIPTNLATLETHASEMATLLNSLVKHFDNCVNALKHTEGGFAGLRAGLPEGTTISGVLQPSDSKNFSLAEEEPLDEAERRKLLNLVIEDAYEVDGVVNELRDRLQGIESAYGEIANFVQEARSRYQNTLSAWKMLEEIGMRLPQYLAASHDYRHRWHLIRETILHHLEDIEGMREFYLAYYASYDKLILEVERRRKVEEDMKKVVKKAMEQVGKLWEGDAQRRNEFRNEVGEFLPADLWEGGRGGAPKWEVVVKGQGEGEGEETPGVERGVVEGARKRERQREMMERV